MTRTGKSPRLNSRWDSMVARVNALANPVTDPISGQPELKHTPVHIEPCTGLRLRFSR
jgi:hypothetical protein